MKRGAERQLAKDDAEEEFDNGEDPGRGFQKAKDRVLAGRKIRALPKRVVGGSAPPPVPSVPALAAPTLAPPPSAPATTAPKFSGFAGFGSSGGTSSFTFNAPAPAAAPPAPKPAAATLPTNFSFGAPSVSPSASNATKTFASFLSPPKSDPKPTLVVEKPKASPIPEDDDEELKVETKYLTALRGLNTSFLSAVSKAVQSDPFSDVANLLERYKDLRVSVQSEYDNSVKALKTSGSTTKAPPAPPSSGFSFAGKPAPSLPSVPSGFAGFPKPSSTSSSPFPSTGGGFVPKIDSTSTSTTNPFAFPDREVPKTPGFVFGSSNPPPAPTASKFTFGTPSSSGGLANPFGSSSDSIANPFAPSSKLPSSPPPVSVFSSNLFSKPKESDEMKEQDKDKSDTGIGKGLPSSFNTSPERPAGSFLAFPASSSSAPSAPKSGGNLGNPFGFGFASSAKPAEGDKTGSSAPSSTFTFTPFSAPAKPASTEGGEGGDGGGEADESPAVEQAKLGLKRNLSVHDLPGEGEESEDIVQEVRGRVFKLIKKSGGQDWADQGVGILRLKKHKETGASRLLMRNSLTGKIILNFNVYSSMAPVQAKNILSFVGHDNSDSAETSGNMLAMKFRTRAESEVADLKAAIEREIEFVKSKAD